VLNESSCIEFPFPPSVISLSTDFANALAAFFLLLPAGLLVPGVETFLLFGTAELDNGFCFFLEVSFFVEDSLLEDSLSTKNKPMGN
jgi:hypothetical protein